jgi:hypothetical protein
VRYVYEHLSNQATENSKGLYPKEHSERGITTSSDLHKIRVEIFSQHSRQILILTMTFHRTLLVLRRGPLAGNSRHAVIVTNAVSSLANITPFAVSSSVQAGQWWGMSRSMTTMVHWPGDEASMSPARAKLQHVLEEYRQNKYVNILNAILGHSHVLHHSFQAHALHVSFRFVFSHSSLLLFLCLVKRIFSFSQTLFSRFLKEMIHATDANHDGYISRSELSKLLDNIGAKGKLLDSEVQEIMDELGQMDEEQQELLIHIENLEDTILSGVH